PRHPGPVPRTHVSEESYGPWRPESTVREARRSSRSPPGFPFGLIPLYERCKTGRTPSRKFFGSAVSELFPRRLLTENPVPRRPEQQSTEQQKRHEIHVRSPPGA